MAFWADSDSEDEAESDFNPYNINNTTKFTKCKYGVFIGTDNYCCHKCMLEKKKHQEEMRYNTFYFISKNEEATYPVNNDWSVLGLIPPKSQKEIKKRYRQLCLKSHPDKGGSKEAFIKITNSYNNLCLVS